MAVSSSPGPNRPRGRERCSAEVTAAAGGAVEGEGKPAAWDEEGGDETQAEEAGSAVEGKGGGVGGGGGVGENIPMGVWLCVWMVTGEGAGNIGGPLGDGEGGFWVRGEGAAMGMSGRGPVALPGGLLIMTGGDGGRGVKLYADHTADLGGGGGVGLGAGAGTGGEA